MKAILPTIQESGPAGFIFLKASLPNRLLEREKLIESRANLVARFSFSLKLRTTKCTFLNWQKFRDQFIEHCNQFESAPIWVTYLGELADKENKAKTLSFDGWL